MQPVTLSLSLVCRGCSLECTARSVALPHNGIVHVLCHDVLDSVRFGRLPVAVMPVDSSNVTFRKVKSSIARIFHSSERSGAAENSGTAADRFTACSLRRPLHPASYLVCRVSPDDGSGYNSEVTTAVFIVIIIGGIRILSSSFTKTSYYSLCPQPPHTPFLSPLTPPHSTPP